MRDIADGRLLAKPRIVVPKWKLIVDPDIIRRFLPEQWLKPVDQADESDSPRSIGPVPLLHAA
jgi:hypothetical protein